MTFRTITAQYAGKCRRCHGPIAPGTRIRYAGRGMTYHLAAECPGSEAPAQGTAARRAWEEDRVAALNGVSVLRSGSGEVLSYRNAAGRCEDAPCCGCCS